MALTGVNYLIPITLIAPGTLAVADDLDKRTIDFPGTIWRVDAQIGTNGTTSGNTDFVVERTRSGTDADLWTPAAGVGRIAHDSSTNYLTWTWDNANMTGYSASQLGPPSGAVLKKGDTIQLNVNVIPGGSDSADLTVTLWVKPAVD